MTWALIKTEPYIRKSDGKPSSSRRRRAPNLRRA
jgi:hypothetical protein